MTDSKKWYESQTIRNNIYAIIGVLVSVAGATGLVLDGEVLQIGAEAILVAIGAISAIIGSLRSISGRKKATKTIE